MTLHEYLNNKARLRRDAGRQDCATFCADWIMARGLPDPMAEWRGTYTDEAQATGIYRDGDGLAAIFDDCMADFDRRSGDPCPGDVGLLQIGGQCCGAIYTGERWAVVAEKGLGFISVPARHIRAVWAVGHG